MTSEEDVRTQTATRHQSPKLAAAAAADQQLLFTEIVATRFDNNKRRMEAIEETKDEDIGEANQSQPTPADDDDDRSEQVASRLSVVQTRFIIIMLALCNFLVANGVSLQGPFFPKEAESKGATPIIYSSIFAIYELVMLVTSLLFGNIVDRFAPSRMSGLGLALAGLSTAIFGLLTYLGNKYYFISLAFILRITESLGATAFATSSYSFISTCFPESTATMFATMEMFFGLGVLTGPVVGGALYDLAGFQLPFLLMGSLMLVFGLLLLSQQVSRLFEKGKREGQQLMREKAEAEQETIDNEGESRLPGENKTLLVGSINDTQDEEVGHAQSSSTNKVTLGRFLSSPAIVIDAFIIVTAITLMGFNGATLEPFLRHDSISSSTLATSAMFVALGASYALTAFLWGKACDRWPERLIWFALVGAFFTFVGLLLIGPIPGVSRLFRPNLWSIAGCLILFGVGTSAKQVVGYTHALKYTIDRRKFPGNQQTYGYISGMFFSCLSLGGFVGPILAGSLLEHFDYQLATAVMLAIEVVVIILLLILQFCCRSFHL